MSGEKIAREALFKISYGLFVLTASENGKDNGCIVNTVAQVTDNPAKITVTVNKLNYTHGMILRTGLFNVSVLTENANFSVFERFGFLSGKDTDKFGGTRKDPIAKNGIRYIEEAANAVICCKVSRVIDCDTHTIFIAHVEEAFALGDTPSVTYNYYFEHIKPKAQPAKTAQRAYICKICGYVYQGEHLPEDYICPICKHGIQDFEAL